MGQSYYTYHLFRVILAYSERIDYSPGLRSLQSCLFPSSAIDPRVQFTLNIVNWDALSSLAHKLHQVDSSHWGDQISGGYNLVRFLHLHDSHNTTLVARVAPPIRG